MKKVILSLIVVFQLLVYLPVSAEESGVPVYMFTKDGCSACDVAYEYFEKLEESEPDLVDLIVIEVFNEAGELNSQNAATLLLGVYEKFDEDSSKISTPTIVIGDYHVLGFPQDENVIYDEITKARDNKDFVDVVKEIADKSSINIDEIKKSEDNIPTTKEENESGKYDTLIIIGIFVVLIGGCAGLVILGRK